MSTVNPTSLNLTAAKSATATSEQRKTMLRQASQEMVGQTFFGEMLKMARNTKLKGTYGHGGRGEEMFGAQLDQEMSKLAGSGMKNSLSDAIYNRLVKNIKDDEYPLSADQGEC